ncbi:MAG TPA: glycosyltransferase family 2 protein [Caldilineaceae bacterium]|nr:glycosyltransferase family 2 protein [Caldilineaceae bacterium]
MVYRKPSPFVSIIFPAYNEETRLPPTLKRTVTFLAQQTYPSEIIVVENGSTDQTVAVVEDFIAQHCATPEAAPHRVTVRLLHSAKGKGAAVKLGMLEAAGDYLVMSDADLSVPIEDLSRFIPPTLPAGTFDVAIASREVPGAVRHDEPEYRHLMGRVFNFLVRVMAVPGVQDTQCGFKCFTREAAHFLFPLQQIDGWGFDVEILHIAARHGLKMVEIPANWYYGQNSRVEPIRDTINMVNELIKVRWYGRRGYYIAAQPFADSTSLSTHSVGK